MSLELQIRSSVLAELAARSVRSQLLVACFPPSPLGFVDHVDGGAAPVEVEPAGGAVRLRMPLDEPDVPEIDQAPLVDAVGSAATVDLAPALKRLGLPSPAASSVELVAGVVARSSTRPGSEAPTDARRSSSDSRPRRGARRGWPTPSASRSPSRTSRSTPHFSSARWTGGRFHRP